jgi:hypothetical protein
MSPSTSPDGLNKQDRGTLEWDTELNNNFDKIQTALTARSLTSHGHSGMALKPAVNDAILYVSPDGDDDDDGLSWGEAKLTILSAYDALPSSGGTIYLGGAGVAVGGAVANQGLWLIGPNDPSFASPPTGWRQQKRLRVVGVGVGSNASNSLGGPAVAIDGGSGSDLAKPALWLSGTNQPIRLENLHFRYPAVAIRMGVNHDRTDRTVNTSGVYMDNVSTELNQVAGNGPGIDVGYLFWWTARNCVFGANGAEAVNTDQRAAILSKPEAGGPSGGLYLLDNCVFNTGNFRYYCGITSWNFHVRNLTFEGDFVNPLPHPIHIIDASNYGNAIVENIIVADAPGSGATVQVDGASGQILSPDAVFVRSASPVEGTAWVDAPYPNSVSALTKSPAGARQVGIQAGRISGRHDSARRGFGPVAARFTNLAPQDVSTWAAKGGTATVTTGKTAPDGTSNAAELSHASTVGNKQIYRANIGTPSVGEWVIAGGWVRAADAAGPVDGVMAIEFVNTNVKFELNNNNSIFLNQPVRGDGHWEWVSVASEISITGATELMLSLFGEVGKPMEFYAPVLLRIGAGLLSDSEVLELQQHLQSYPDGAPVGHISTLRGQKLITHGGLGVGNAATVTGSLPTPTRKMEVFDAAGASLGYVPIYPSIT